MKSKKLLPRAMVAVLLLAFCITPFAWAQGGSGISTAFVLQNLGTNATNATVEFRDGNGNLTKTYPDLPIAVGASVNLDQRYDSGNPGTDPFQGSVIASASEPLGSVVNLMRSTGVGSFESYNGLNEQAVGQNVRVLQILKDVSSGGNVYNTMISIQNTDTAAGTQVTVTFVPDPVLNPAVGGTLTTPVSKSYPLGPGATLFLSQAGQTDPNIGNKFFGSARIESTVTKVAVVTTSDGGGNQLLAYPSYSQGSTSPIGLPSVFKEIISGGDSYSTAFLIANLGSGAATVQIEYFPLPGRGTVSGFDTVVIPANSVKNVDQRYDAPSITSPSFMGAAVVRSVTTSGSGGPEPVAVMANLRGGSRFAMTYGGLSSGVSAGGKLFLPVGYKEISSGGRVWSSTVVFYTFTSNAQVRISFYDNRAGYPAWTSGDFTVEKGSQVDLRYDAATAGHPNFFGAMVVEVISGEVGAVVQSRGLGGTGDSLMAYRGLSQ